MSCIESTGEDVCTDCGEEKAGAKLAEMAGDAALSLGAFIRFTLFGMKKISTEGLLNENE